MGTSSMSGWAVFCFIIGFMLLGTITLGSMLGAVSGAALIAISVVLFQKAKVLEA